MFNIFKKDDKARDPVCGMSVDKEKTQFSSKMDGKIYYFCSENCKQIFVGDNKKQGQEKKGGCC